MNLFSNSLRTSLQEQQKLKLEKKRKMKSQKWFNFCAFSNLPKFDHETRLMDLWLAMLCIWNTPKYGSNTQKILFYVLMKKREKNVKQLNGKDKITLSKAAKCML